YPLPRPHASTLFPYTTLFRSNLLCRLALRLHVRDINFACKLIPRSALRGMRLGSEGSFIDAELLLECRRQGFAFLEFPLTYYPRSEEHTSELQSRGHLVCRLL